LQMKHFPDFCHIYWAITICTHITDNSSTRPSFETGLKI
jgi:hypothetical protein